MLNEPEKTVHFYWENLRCQLTLPWMWQNAALARCVLFPRAPLWFTGAKKVLGTDSPWLSVARPEAGVTPLRRGPGEVGWVGEGPGCSRCSRDRGDIHPLSSTCPPRHHTSRNLSPLIQSVTQCWSGWAGPMACHVEEEEEPQCSVWVSTAPPRSLRGLTRRGDSPVWVGSRNLPGEGKELWAAECPGLPEAVRSLPFWEGSHGGGKSQEKANPRKAGLCRAAMAFPSLSQTVTEDD